MTGTSLLSKAILKAQALHAEDGAARYSHTGIILGSNGATLEALSTIRSENLFEYYQGCSVIIGRHEGMTDERFVEGISAIEDQIGKPYPWYRLFAHLFPAIAIHFNASDRLTCAALASKFFWGCELLSYYEGMNPDKVADMIRDHKRWLTVYEGRLP